MITHSKPGKLPLLMVLIVAVSGAVLFAHSALLSNGVTNMHIDSQVYIYAAQQMLKGQVLYRDVFDHKGPVMYLYECCGVALSGKNFTGLWFTQLIFFIAGVSPLFYYWAKRKNVLSSAIAFLFMISWIFRTKTIGDNLPEIVAISFISFFFFLYLKINEQPEAPRQYFLLTGMCGMALLMLKPNLAIVIIPGALWLCIAMLKQKTLTTFLLYSVAGSMVVLIPIAAYFAWHDALKEAIFAYWTFNFSYLADQQLSIAESIRQVFIRPVNYLFAFVLLAGLAKFLTDKKERPLFLFLLISVLLSVLMLVGIPGRGAESAHYALPMAPLIAWLVMHIAHGFNKLQMAILLMVAIFFCKPLIIHLFIGKTSEDKMAECVVYLNKHKKPDETLCILGNRSSLYWQTAMPCNTPFFYTYPITRNCSGELNQKFNQASEKNMANWIVYEPQFPFDSCMMMLLKNYELVASTESEKIYYLK